MASTIDFNLTFGKSLIPVRIYAEGALYWPDGQTLFVTDPHFGKADSFRHAGIPIPTAVHNHDLARLSKLITDSGAINLVVLGDFFHTRHSQSEGAIQALEEWRSQHADLEIVLVLGNHDAHAGNPPEQLNIHSVEAPLTLGSFVCYHQPQAKPSKSGYILAGHLHPYIVIRDRDGSRMRLPAYIFGPNQGILPAFGGFTGGSAYAPSSNDRVFVIAESEIMEIPTTRPPRGKSTIR